MKKKLVIFLAMGIVSAIALVYFYIQQKDFTRQHKEFLVNINEFENRLIETTNIILKNSLYIYTNQDEISHSTRRLEKSYQALLHSSILKKENYKSLYEHILSLEDDLSKNKRTRELFLRANANIKNSLLFLSRHLDNGSILQKHNYKEYIKAIEIVKSFNDAKKLQDFDYIKNKDYTLSCSHKNEELHNYIESFNLHSEYFVKHYKFFIKYTQNSITNKKTNEELHAIYAEFSKVSLSDFRELNIFASILFSTFFISLATIVFLIFKYYQEHIKLKKMHDTLEYSLIYDHLTKIYNRMKLEKDLLDAKNPAFILIDIQEFKNINDIYGKEVGNLLLHDFSKTLFQYSLKIQNSHVYRIGADEFGFLLQECSSKEALVEAKKIEEKIKDYVFCDADITIDLKVNIAVNTIAPLLENADLILKQIKKTNFTNLALYEENLQLKEDIEENLQIIAQIKSALKEDRIIPYFQPIVDLQIEKIIKYEALVRLKLPDGTLLAPFKFLDIAKRSSLYLEITQTMILKVIEMAKKFPQYRYSINFSMLDIADEKITSMLFEILEQNKDIASLIDIELLESEYLENLDEVASFIKKLHTYGSLVLLDDFGTGYSNFAYFSKLDIDIIKIDGSIVSEITTNKRKLHMLKSIKQFANGMNMKTVSEFVENKEIAQSLQKLGAAYGQGYYFSPPVAQPLSSDDVEI